MKNQAVALILAVVSSSAFLQAQLKHTTNWADAPTVTQEQRQTTGFFSPLVHLPSLKEIGEYHSGGNFIPHGTSVSLGDREVESEPQGSSTATYAQFDARQASETTSYKASSYVPLDSWIYPAFDRLAAVGPLPTSTAILRPWTRLECARLLAEAHIAINYEDDDVAGPIFAALDKEFRSESTIIDGGRNASAGIESAYSRVTGIAGTPIRDGFHFASTITNDFGRPFGNGINSYDGLSGSAQFGPFAVYGRAEYQYASAMPEYSTATKQFLAANDVLPVGWNLRSGTTSRLRPIEAYVSLNLANWQLSFGQQSLWWAPDRSTSLILSNNAEALPMFRITRAKPATLPSFLSKLGPVHLDMFLARQGGVHYVGLGSTFAVHGTPDKPLKQPPYLWGFAFTVKPTEYLELGFAHTVIFAGYSRPLTFETFFHTFSVDGNGQEIEPGKRVTAFNFAYHPPFLRQSLVLYSEAMAWDNPIQGKFVGRYAFSPGIYIPQMPKLPKLDLRLEAAYTDLPKLPIQGYFYTNHHYIEGYTNYGQILGSWVGPQGIGGEASSTYWFSPRTKASISYRKMVSDVGYFQGGHRDDVSGKLIWTPNASTEISGDLQYGHWNFPAVSPTSKSDFTTTIQIRFFPQNHRDH
ncbi:capsule assembly Wzi family protein [Terriglobus albidus]|uniref:Capsule assembly Wzi family protein n=1 Tax=Terriglobus albidus TaxID=1592106 RepID=A0A5B9E933_9BACT|nr:capsule assembly Wzi family protein [Terriglobus albidus]